MTTATLIAGIPAHNDTLYHRIRFAVGDPAACLELPEGRLLIVRDIEMDRARTQAHAIELPVQPTSHPKVVWMAIEKQPPHRRRPKRCDNAVSKKWLPIAPWACSLSNSCVPPGSRSGSIPIWVWLNGDKKMPRSWKCSTSVNV